MNKIYDVLTTGVLECVNSTKYKSPNSRRFDICNRYNSAISHILEHTSCGKLNTVGRATVKGCKGFITKSICDNLTDEELAKYITDVVCPLLKHLFADLEF